MATGLVLAGGASRRMGRDKATMTFGGRPLVAHVADLLRAAGAREILVACGDASRSEALAALAGARARSVPDAVPGQGPVAGLAAGLGAARGLVLVAPVDSPSLAPAAYAPLVDACAGRDAAVWASARGSRGGVAWLHAVFDAERSRAGLADALARGDREVSAACARLDAAILPEGGLLALPGGGRHLDNWNEPRDVA